MFYKERVPKYISAYQFNDLADIPGSFEFELYTDKKYSGPSDNQLCNNCQKAFKFHGIFNGSLVCPGTYILCTDGQPINLMSKENFEALYVPIGEVIKEINKKEVVND